MTLNCDVEISVARRAFAEAPDDGTARDLIESSFEYWKSDQIDDATLAKDLRTVLPYLERAAKSA